MELGRFVKPPKAISVSSPQEAWEKYGRKSIAYPKKDGWHFQIHVDGQQITLYSRTGKNYADRLPATARRLVEQVGGQRAILGVEMVGYNTEDRPLPPERLLKAHHHRCWVLDALYLDDEDLTTKPTVERLEQLSGWLSKRPGATLVSSEFHRFTDSDSWHRFFGQCLQEGLEGAILKLADSDYFTPVYKVKPFETIDAIVIAGYRDRSGEASASFKSLLLGAPAASGQRIAVMGTVDRDELNNEKLWAAIMNALESFGQEQRPLQVDATPHNPSIWFAPKVVLEVDARANRNKVDPHYTVGGDGGPGYRFDRIVVKRLREDKAAGDATTEEELIRLLTLPPVQTSGMVYQLTLFDQALPIVKRGELEVVVGCMFSGKTTHLIERIKRLRDTDQPVAVFYPQVDTRTFDGYLRTHKGQRIEATSVAGSADLAAIAALRDENVIIIDEAQFFDDAIVDVCLDLVGKGKQMIVAGLDLDFRGEPFGPMPHLLACADRMTKLNAVCSVCGEPAFFSQRLPDGQPATFFERIVVPGGETLYQPRCREHHVVPGKALQVMRQAEEGGNVASYLWNWLQRMRAIGQIGLSFGPSVYDRERYNDILEISGEMADLLQSDIGNASAARPHEWLLPNPDDLAYVTPKVAVAIALFNAQGRILLVQRADNQNWALPGGWADVGYTPAESAVRELFQETGLHARCDGLVGVYDGRQARVGVLKECLYTLLFHCQLISGEISPHRHEITGARFVTIDEDVFHQLTSGTARHVEDAVAYHKSPRPACFDLAQ